MIYTFGECTLDDQLYQLYRAGTVVKVEPKAFDLLAYLIAHRDRAIARDELFEHLWPGQIVSEAALTYSVAKARKAVQDDGITQAIISNSRPTKKPSNTGPIRVVFS
jgi:DNA-binding winged helix-turn-helix (wHTH) protein